MSVIHTHSIRSSSKNERKLYLVQSGGTQYVDSARKDLIVGVKWFVSLKDQVTKRGCSYDVTCIYNEDDNSVSFVVHNILGTPIPNITTVELMGGTHMVIQITNNSVNSIEIRILKHVLEL